MALAQKERTASRAAPSGIGKREAARQKTNRPRDEGNQSIGPSSLSLRTFAGGIVQDFNNLLTIIIGNAWMMREQLPADSPLLRMLEPIVSAAHRAENVTRQLALYAERCEPLLESLNLSSLIQDFNARFTGCIGSNIFVEYDLKADLPEILADRSQMTRLIKSLLFNAAEAIGETPGVIRVRTQALRADRAFLATHCAQQNLTEGRYVWLQISDTGCGMDEEIQKHIFEPFFSTKFVGRGLGLSAGLGIVRQHHGAIWVASRPVRGTNVNVLLPCVSAERIPLPSAIAENPLLRRK